jgi:tetratricopeptide (TPR) repeat protein
MNPRRFLSTLLATFALVSNHAAAAAASPTWQGWLEVRAHAGPGCAHEPTPPYRRPVQLIAVAADDVTASPSWLVLGAMEPVRIVPRDGALALLPAEDARRTLGRIDASGSALPVAGSAFTAGWAERADAVDGGCAFAQAELQVEPATADADALSRVLPLLSLWSAQSREAPEAVWPAPAVAEALAHFEALAQPAMPPSGLGGLAGDLAEQLWSTKRRAEAAPLLAVAAALYARDGELALRHRALALARLGELMGSLRRSAAAEVAYREALALAQARNDARLVARLHNHLGTLLLRGGRADEAGQAFEQAVAGERRGGDVLDLAVALNNLGQSQERSGQTALARRSYEDALTVIAMAGEQGSGLAAMVRHHLEQLDAPRGSTPRTQPLGA